MKKYLLIAILGATIFSGIGAAERTTVVDILNELNELSKKPEIPWKLVTERITSLRNPQLYPPGKCFFTAGDVLEKTAGLKWLIKYMIDKKTDPFLSNHFDVLDDKVMSDVVEPMRPDERVDGVWTPLLLTDRIPN